MVTGSPTLTTEITVTCGFCQEMVQIPFRHGAVMPMQDSDQGVHVYIPRLDGGDHACPSLRHKQDREWYMANKIPRR